MKDIQDACKLFESIYDQTDAGDGYVSVEVSPRLADDTNGTVEAAKYLHKVVDRRNVYIKIPATAACVPSIKDVISLGISVNVTVSSCSFYASMLSFKEIAHKIVKWWTLVVLFYAILDCVCLSPSLVNVYSVWHTVVPSLLIGYNE